MGFSSHGFHTTSTWMLTNVQATPTLVISTTTVFYVVILDNRKNYRPTYFRLWNDNSVTWESAVTDQIQIRVGAKEKKTVLFDRQTGITFANGISVNATQERSDTLGVTSPFKQFDALLYTN